MDQPKAPPLPAQDAMKRPTLLLVDDEPVNLQVLRQILQDDYRLLFARDGERALQLAAEERPQLMLLDVMMPGLSGLDVCRKLKADPMLACIPVIFVTALGEEPHEVEGFAAGAVDYIAKPVSPMIVRARVRTQLSMVRIDDLQRSRMEIAEGLGRAAEFRDNETGRHVIRMSWYSRILADALGYGEDLAQDLQEAASLHDVGKIGVPDAVLLKKGPLTEEEWMQMRRHPQIGAEIIGEHGANLLQMARRIALYHHEKWDGSGYPDGLSARDIPVEARIVAIADVFDALTSERPYKPAWDIERAVAYLQEQSGKQFDPEMIELFVQNLQPILAIRQKWLD